MQTPLLQTGADRQGSITISAASIAPFIIAMLQPPAPLSLDQIKEALGWIWEEIEQQVNRAVAWLNTWVDAFEHEIDALLSGQEVGYDGEQTGI